MIKILQINKFYYEQGGAEHYFFSLKKLLEEHGHEVVPFAMEHKNNLESPYSQYFPSYVETLKSSLSVPKIKAVGRMFYSFEAKRKLEALLQKVKPDMAHVHNIYHQISPSILSLFKKNGIPVVMTIHDYKLICPNYMLYTKGAVCQRCQGGRFCQAFYHKCMKDSYVASALVALEMHFHQWLKVYKNNISFLITPSNFVKNKLVEFGWPSDRIAVLPHFVESKDVPPATTLGGYLLYAGRLRKEKGVDVLIKAMRNLPQAELRIAGTGPDEPELKKMAAGLENVKFIGQIPKSEIMDLYSQSLGVVVPSRVWETFGLTVVEAMSYGKPVIASRMGALVELVEDGKTGLLFESENPKDLADKINYLISNPEVAVEMGKKGREKVKNDLNPEKHYQELMKIYDKLLISNS